MSKKKIWLDILKKNKFYKKNQYKIIIFKLMILQEIQQKLINIRRIKLINR